MATTRVINWENEARKKDRMRAFAWAKYFEMVREGLDWAHKYRRSAETVRNDTTVPEHIKNEFLAMGDELKKKWECPVCIEMIPSDKLDITPCGHFFCKECLVEYKKRNATDCKCPICRRGLRS